MMRNLPRHWFGKVQGQLFPKYFTTQVVLFLIGSVCHTLQHPFVTWSGLPKIQGYSLLVGTALSVVNCLVMEPRVHGILNELHAMEKERDVGNVVGPLQDKELLSDSKYKSTRRGFLKWHGASMLGNLMTMVVSGINLYCFASRL